MFKSFKSLKTVRTLFDQAENLYRVAKRVLEKVGSRFRDGYKRFAKNSLFYTEALPNVIGVTTSYTKGAGFESINQSQVSGLRSFSAYDIIGASSIDDQYLTFRPNVSSSDYPKPTFDPDDSVGAGIFTKSLWNHNQLPYSNNILEGSSGYYISQSLQTVYEDSTKPEEISEATAIEFTKTVPWNAPNIFRILAPAEDIISSWDPDRKKFIWSYYFKITNKEDSSQSILETRLYDKTDPDLHTALNVYFTSTNNPTTNNSEGVIDDLGNGWYRVSMTADDTYAPNNTYAGDKPGLAILWSGAENDRVVIAAPQLEQHPMIKPSWSHNSVWQDMEQWTEGTGNQGSDWAGWGDATDSIREYRTDPFGKQSILWVSQDNDTDTDGEGGFMGLPNVSIDAAANYRYSVWMRKPSDFIGNGTLYFGAYFNPASNPLYTVEFPVGSYSVQTNPYFITGSHSELLPNPGEWYLAVGFIDASGTNRGSYHPDTGFYDLEGNQRQAGTIRSWQFTSTATHQSIRAFQNANPAGQGDEVEFWAPRIDKLDGNEPSISDLLNPIDNPNYPPVTKATPYVGNDAIPANVHRHNWLNYTNDLATSSNWNFTRVDLQPSTIGTSVYSGETAYEVVPDDPIGNWPIIYTSGDGISFNADETKVASVYIKSHDKNPTFMPPINSNYSGLEAWTVGTGGMTDWVIPPSTEVSSNIREYAEDPFGGQSIVWKAYDDGPGDLQPWEGGIYAAQGFTTAVDASKPYRFSIFVKQHDNKDGTIFFGPANNPGTADRAVVNRTLGTLNGNPYFVTGDNKTTDDWYLYVGYINPSGLAASSSNYSDLAGTYDMSGNRVGVGYNEFDFSSTTLYASIRAFYYGDGTNDSAIGASFFHPRIDALDGNEPSIERLLDSVKAKQPAVNFPAFAEIPWLDEGLTDFYNTSGGWNAVDTANATTTTSSLKTPFNTEEVVVVANNEPSPDGPYEGGIRVIPTLPIDNTKKYRYSIFAKKATDEGGIYLGPATGSEPSIAVRRLNDGSHQTNPYFIQNKDFGTSEWVLLVGHIWPHTTAVGTANDSDTGVWSMDGNKIAAYSNDLDLMTSSTTTEQGFRAFFYGDVTDDLNKAYFWQPRIDIVDGTEPSVEELLRLQPGLTINLLDFSAPTKIHRAAFGVDASGVVYPKYIVGGELDGFGVEEVGDGWYRAWAYKEGLDSVSNTVEGDDLYYYLYFGDAAQPFADVSATINNDFRSTLIMKPMVERLGIDQVVSNPPTAYQEVSDNTWPSVSAIPYHQVAKEVELSIKDDTTGSSYTAKAYWDGGKLYNYGPRITNQDVEITQLQDGWHKFGTGIRGLGDGTINAGDTASMTFSYAASSNPRSKTLISGPILANTGSEKSSKVNYSVGTNTPGVNLLDRSDDITQSTVYAERPAVIDTYNINHANPHSASSFIIKTDEGLSENNDWVSFFAYENKCKASASDTVVGHIHAKSLWNYNELPYTRNMTDDPGFNYEGDTNGTFYSLGELQYPIDETDKGPDGVSQALTFYNDHPSLGTREFFTVGGLSYIPSSTLHAWDDNLVVNFSIHLKRPDNVEDTVPRFLLYLSDHTDPENTQAIYFDWGPSSTHPYHYTNNHQYKQVTFTDAGDGWYRVCWSVSGLGSNPNQNAHNGDKMSFRILAMDSLGKSIKYAQPQIEFHTINDTNLLKPSWDWYAGVSGYGNMGNWSLDHETTSELRVDPFGLSSLCIVGTDTSAYESKDGGLASSPNINPIDVNSTYRYSMFFKLYPEPSGTRSMLIGPQSTANPTYRVRDISTGNANTNPYFGQFGENVVGNDWLLFVGHVQPSGTAPGSSNHADTGIYSLDGTKLSNYTIDDFMWDSTTIQQSIRAFGWMISQPDDDDGADAINLWSPRIEKVDGTEPSISELLASGNLWTNPNYQQTLPSPYVENVGIHPNPHRHNWLNYTNDLANTSQWVIQAIDVTPSTVGTTYANGETCFEIVHNSLVASQTSLFANRTNVNADYGTIDENTGYIYSVYLKQHPTKSNGTDVANIRLYDVTVPQAIYSVDVTWSSIGAVPTIASLQGPPTDYGIEEVADGWYRAWVYNDALNANTIEGDQYTAYIYLNGGGSRNAALEGKGILAMRPMMELVPSGYTINNVPRAYQEVQGEWDLGVTSIPEHQCANQLRLDMGSFGISNTASYAFFRREGGVWKLVDPEDSIYNFNKLAGNASEEHVGDGWYKLTHSLSGLFTDTVRSRTAVEGENVRVLSTPADFYPVDVNRISHSLLGAPFMGMTGSLDVSSVPHTRGVLE